MLLNHITKTVYPITIDYTKSLYEMIDSTQVKWFNPEVNPARFIICGVGQKECNVELIRFNRTVLYHVVLRQLQDIGRRPTKIEELLALAAAHPNLQCRFPIIGLGSTCRINGSERVPFLHGRRNTRDIRLSHIDVAWSTSFRFAAVNVS